MPAVDAASFTSMTECNGILMEPCDRGSMLTKSEDGAASSSWGLEGLNCDFLRGSALGGIGMVHPFVCLAINFSSTYSISHLFLTLHCDGKISLSK